MFTFKVSMTKLNAKMSFYNFKQNLKENVLKRFSNESTQLMYMSNIQFLDLDNDTVSCQYICLFLMLSSLIFPN